MELVAKKISKANTGNSEKLSKGSFFKPAPALVPQTPVNKQPTFFKPAIKIPKTADNTVQTEAPITTGKIDVEPTPVVVNKAVETIPVIEQPATENSIQQAGQSSGNNQEQAVNSNSKTTESNVAALPVSKINGTQVDEKTAPAKEGGDAEKETKPGLRFINAAATEKVFQGKIKKAGKLAKAAATTKTASEKISESEKAQDKPEAEQHSDSNHGQVEGYAGLPVADKTKAESQNALSNAIEQVIPKSLGDVRDFKAKGKAKHISNAVSTQVKGDVGSVKSSFGGMGKTSAPAAAEKGTVLPLPEEAEHIEQLNMSAGVIPQVEVQHLDTSDYLKQNDELLKKEELPQEHLDMVDSGDLAEANKQRIQLKIDAAEQPKEIKETAATEHKQLNADMHAEEKHGRQEMAKHRGGKLKDTCEKQKATKTKLEKEREDVAKLINGKYETCQKNIISKLDALEKDSLARFDRGQAKATTDFENQVNADIAEFKRKRYDEVGWARRKYRQARDWLLGIDDFPEVEKAFSDARKTFETTIDTLLNSITADNNKVIAECKTQLQTTKVEIAGIVEKLKPALKSAGDAAMKDVEKKLDELNAEVDKRKEKMQQQLADKRQAAMKAIDAKIEKMKEALSGALSAIGKLLLEALKKFFKWALEKLGIDAEGFFNTLSKIGTAIKAMFKSPGKFFSNLIAAVKGAISDFKTNFKTYLTGALFDWLTGSIGSVVTLPKVFDVKGVLGIIMQIAGISWAFIRSKLVNIFGEQKVAYAEKTVAVVKKFVDEGIMGIWDWIKNSAQSLMSTMIDSIKEWLLTKLVISFAEWIASLLIPGGAILRLVQGIYKLIMWFIDNIQRILRWVNAVLDGMVSIASGAIAGAIGFIVGGMKLIIPAILDFFAKLLNIGGIVDAVKNIINKITDPIHKAIDKMVDWLKGILNKLVASVKGGVSAVKAKVLGWLGLKKEFTDESGEHHSLFYKESNPNAELMVASTPRPIKIFLQEYISTNQNDPARANKVAQAREALDFIREHIIPLQRQYSAAKSEAEKSSIENQMLIQFEHLSNTVRTLLGRGNLNAAFDKYHLEGLSGTYATMPKPKGDNFTADHQPQAAIFEEAADMPFFNEPGVNNLKNRAAGRANKGFAINLHYIRHIAGRTYGSKGGQTKNEFLALVASRTAGLTSSQDKRNAVVEILKNELKKDVFTMRIIARRDDAVYWSDLEEIKQQNNLSDKEFEQLKSRIRNQILAGEDQLLSQNMDDLKS